MTKTVYEWANACLQAATRALQKPAAQPVLAAVFAYLLFPHRLSSASCLCEWERPAFDGCIDPSWQLSINMAVKQNLVFGKEYVLTYGPLGFLNTRNTLDLSPAWLVAFDLFLLLNFFYAFFYCLRRQPTLPMCALCLLTAYTVPFDVFGLLIISYFWLNHALRHKRVQSLLIPALIACVSFYIKFNTVFTGLLFFYGYLAVFFFTQSGNRLAKIFAALLVPAGIFLLSFPLRTHIVGYVRGGLEMINGYHDAMGRELGNYRAALVAAGVVVLLFLSIFWSKNLRSCWLVFGTGLLFTFTLFKQSFVRPDFIHLPDFFYGMPGLCCVVLLFQRKVSSGKVLAGIAACLVCITVNRNENLSPKKGPRLAYAQELLSPVGKREKVAAAFDRFRLPAGITKLIDTGSVDVVPWNIGYIYFNRLHYNPRPVVQSYTVYTPYLVNLNRQKYTGSSAPDLVFFSNAAIDDRYPFFDDQGVKLALVENYSCIGYFDSAQNNPFLVFKKSHGQAAFHYSMPVEKTMKFFEDYILDDTSKIYHIAFGLDYTAGGKLLRAAYKPPELRIRFTLANDSTKRYRAIKGILKAGVIINPLIEDETDFLNFANGRAVPAAKRIKSFRLEWDGPPNDAVAKAAFEKVVHLQVSEVSITRR